MSAGGSSWIDSHCHLQSLAAPDEAMARARAAGVEAVVCVGTDLETSTRALALADRHPDVVATVGLHPHEASKLALEWAELTRLSAAEGVVAVGETGLDYHYEHSPRDEQVRAFRAHIRLAHERDLALVVHTRDAWADTFRILDEEGVPPRAIVHCFSGGVQQAERALERGMALSFSGIVSFKNAVDVRAAAAITPPERALVETDAPFLAPVPHRGRENEPAWVVEVGAALARATGAGVDDVASATRSVARTLLRI